jgi:SulP family sulfate permease
VLSGVNEAVRKVLEKSGLADRIGEENICSNIQEAVQKANSYI